MNSPISLSWSDTEVADYSIRPATETDLADIRSWLKQEDDDDVDGSFWCNMKVIDDAQKRGALTVLALATGDKPIAFAVTSSTGIEIMEVKADLRGQGYGQTLARHAIDEAHASGMMGLYGECNPENSFGFWQRMGFEQVDSFQKGLRVALPFRRHRELVAPTSTIRIELSYESPGSKTLKSFETRATLEDPGYLLEDEFVEYFDGLDAMISIWIDGNLAFSDYVSEGEDVGVEREDYWVRVSIFEAPPCG